MADSIMAIGLIQNLVVHFAAGRYVGVAAGGRRLARPATVAQLDGVSMPDIRLSSSVSVTRRWSPRWSRTTSDVAMHPAEQISGFRTLSRTGKTPAQIPGTSWATVPVTFSTC
ncbi:hypothetical protein MJ575_00590 [Klebsiella pneumoniae]|nr:hypothetical protein MJ575_00590 [Klebsiella pneumoniae]